MDWTQPGWLPAPRHRAPTRHPGPPGYQAGLQRLRRREHPAGEDEIQGHLLPGQPAEQGDHHGRNEAALDLGVPQLGTLGATRQVTRGGQSGTAGECPALHHRDHGLGQRAQPLEQAAQAKRGCHVLGSGSSAEARSSSRSAPAQKSFPAPRIRPPALRGRDRRGRGPACTARSAPSSRRFAWPGDSSVRPSTPSSIAVVARAGHREPGRFSRPRQRRAEPGFPSGAAPWSTPCPGHRS